MLQHPRFYSADTMNNDMGGGPLILQAATPQDRQHQHQQSYGQRR
jgi:hypothetical protein